MNVDVDQAGQVDDASRRDGVERASDGWRRTMVVDGLDQQLGYFDVGYQWSGKIDGGPTRPITFNK